MRDKVNKFNHLLSSSNLGSNNKIGTYFDKLSIPPRRCHHSEVLIIITVITSKSTGSPQALVPAGLDQHLKEPPPEREMVFSSRQLLTEEGFSYTYQSTYLGVCEYSKVPIHHVNV